MSAGNSKGNAAGSDETAGAELLLDRQDFLIPSAVGTWTPPVDICQTPTRIIIRIELPGVDPADIRLSHTGENLRIQGIKREEPQSRKMLCYYCLERRYGKFDRMIPVKEAVNPQRSRAYFKKGILTVELPRLKERRGNKVEIRIETK